MNKSEIYQIIEKILIEEMEVEKVFNENSALIGEGVIDSLEFMNYVSKIEERFSISISNEDLEEKQLGVIPNMISYLLKLS
jgi:acyl carrier protein